MDNIERLKIRIPQATEAELEDVLETAKDTILSRCFVSIAKATAEEKAKMLEEHNEKVLKVAVIIYNMRGIEGQISHSENGISRSFAENEGLKPILEQIIPRCNIV